MDVAQLISPSDYAAERQNAFPSLAAVEWFMRRHRPALNEARAVVVVNRRVLIVPDRFDGVVLDIGAAQSQREVLAA